MDNNTAKRPIIVLGIDLAKQSFQFHGVNTESDGILKKKLNRVANKNARIAWVLLTKKEDYQTNMA